MIKVEGFRAFHGIMRITPKAKGIPVREIEADWLYKPEYRCWYGAGMSFSEEICEVVRDGVRGDYIERSVVTEYFEKSKQVMWHKDDVVAAISSPTIITGAKMDGKGEGE